MNKLCMVLALACITAAAAAQSRLLNGGFETGQLDPWQTKMPAQFFSITSDAVHAGGFALRASGDAKHRYNAFATLVQKLELAPIPGGTYRISCFAQAKLGTGKKRVQLAVREVGKDAKTIRYVGPTIHDTKRQWRHYEQTFRASATVTAFQVYLILGNLEKTDIVYVDDVAFDCLTGTGAPVTAQPSAFDPAALRQTSNDALMLTSAEFTASIDRSTGLLQSLVLLEPKPKLLQPPAKATTCVFFQRADKEMLFTQLVGELETSQQGDVQEATAHLAAENAPLRATVQYRLTEDCFEERVEFEATADVKAICRVGVRHGFVPKHWDKIIGALRPVRVVKADQATSFCYNERDHDLNRGRLDPWQGVTFPFAVLEGDDRFVLVGDLSADAFVTIAPNDPMGYFPSVQQNPTRLRKGQRLTFSLVYKALPKDTHLLRDAWRWYGRRFHSANPLIADCLRYEPPYPPRTLPSGCHISASGHYTRNGLEIDTSRTIPGSNIWYFGWHDWLHERYPSSGSWWAGVAGWQKTSAETFRALLAQYKQQGFKCYLYFRQIANISRAGVDYPAHWVKKVAGGGLELYGGGYSLSLPDKVAADAGYDEIRWGTYEFGQKDFRRDYLDQLKACLDYYQPAGIGWDMGWAPNNPGILAVQAAAFRYMRQRHPAMRVIANEASGTPSQFFADAILIENGIIFGKSWYDYEVAKAFNTYFVSIERPEHYIRVADAVLSGKSGWPSKAGFADAKRFLDYAIVMGGAAQKPDKRDLALRANVRAGLRDLGMGCNWAYADMTQLAFGRKLPEELVRFMTEIAALPLITRSYALRLNGHADRTDDLYAAGWCSSQQLRLAVFNDAARPATIEVSVDGHTLAERGWDAQRSLMAQSRIVTTDAETLPTRVKLDRTRDGLMLSARLPAFALLIVSANR